jgi:hypothetical protein
MVKNRAICPICKLSDATKQLNDEMNVEDEILFQRATGKLRKQMSLLRFFTGQTIPGRLFSGDIVIGIPAIIFFCVCAFLGTPISQTFASLNVSENSSILITFAIFIIFLLVIGILGNKLIRKRLLRNIPELIENMKDGHFYYCSRDDIIFNIESRQFSKPEDILDIAKS